MSTRCQVKVSDYAERENVSKAVTLYHHSDGYPTAMLQVMADAYKNAKKYLEEKAKGHGIPISYWELNRAGEIASFLCREEPDQFEPEAGHQLHGDIEWYYELKPSNTDRSNAANPKWIVTVYKITGFDKDQKKIPIVEGELQAAAKLAEAIEAKGDKIANEEYEKREKKRMKA